MNPVPSVQAFPPHEWRIYREQRLRALADSWYAIGGTLAEELGRSDTEWSSCLASGTDKCWLRMDPANMVLSPVLIYRPYRCETLVDESLLKIAMRCYYPEEFVQLIEKQGFRVLQQWGGYEGEVYGQGSKLVVQFTESS